MRHDVSTLLGAGRDHLKDSSDQTNEVTSVLKTQLSQLVHNEALGLLAMPDNRLPAALS